MDDTKTRAFVCVRFPDEAVKEIARVQEMLSGRKFMGKITELENLHVTLKFLGEIDEEMLTKVKERLKEVKYKVFEAKLSEIGTFARNERPKIVWIKIGGRAMFELQKKVDSALVGLFAPEQRFMSHLTIARVRHVSDAQNFQEHVRKISVRDVRFSVQKFFLMKSVLGRIGPTYTEIVAYPLEEENILKKEGRDL